MRLEKFYRVITASIFILTLFSGPASAEPSATESARRIYPAVGRRHWILAECAKVDPSRKATYDDTLRSYDRANSVLMQKVRAILVADARKDRPALNEQIILSTYDRWLESDQNKMNHAIQSGDPEQFRQQCDYIANPEGRMRGHLSRQWILTLIGQPSEQYPAEVKAIMSWNPKESK